jgi:hypothetical protein
MAGTGKKVLTGCGIGCGLVIALNVVCGTGGYVLMKRLEGDFQQTIEAQADLERDLGTIDDYVPAADGAVAADRLETFLAARARLEPARDALAESFAAFAAADEKATLSRILSAIGAGIGLAPKIADFVTARTEALTAEDIGFGEYAYIYCLCYYAFLGHAPDDETPGGHLKIESESRDGVFIIRTESDEDENLARQRYRRVMLGALERRLDLVAGRDDAAGERLAEEIRAEIARLVDDPERLPYADGLSRAVATSLEPYRARLEDTWWPATNLLELARMHKEGKSFIVE